GIDDDAANCARRFQYELDVFARVDRHRESRRVARGEPQQRDGVRSVEREIEAAVAGAGRARERFALDDVRVERARRTQRARDDARAGDGSAVRASVPASAGVELRVEPSSALAPTRSRGGVGAATADSAFAPTALAASAS